MSMPMPDDASTLDAIANLLGLSLFELKVYIAWAGLSLGIGVIAAVIYETALHWHSPLEEPGSRACDPFAHPFGDIPVVPFPRGSILGGPAERSPAESGIGFSSHELQSFQSAGVANPAVREGSGGNGNTSRGAAAARPLQGRARRAF